MGFTHVQGNVGSNNSTGSVSVVLSSAPTARNLVVVGFICSNATSFGSVTVQDGNSNYYKTYTNNSIYDSSADIGVITAYIFPAPANASATITANNSFSSSNINSIVYADEFSVTGVVEVDSGSNFHQGGSGVNMVLPSVTPSFNNELFYCIGGSAQSGAATITAPVNGGTLGGWTGLTVSSVGTLGGEYQIGVSSATAPDFTPTATSSWLLVLTAFYNIPPIPLPMLNFLKMY